MKFSCPSCGRSYATDDSVRGRAFRMTCRACGAEIVVGAAAAGAPARAVSPSDAPPPQAPPPLPGQRPALEELFDDLDVEDAPPAPPQPERAPVSGQPSALLDALPPDAPRLPRRVRGGAGHEPRTVTRRLVLWGLAGAAAVALLAIASAALRKEPPAPASPAAPPAAAPAPVRAAPVVEREAPAPPEAPTPEPQRADAPAVPTPPAAPLDDRAVTAALAQRSAAFDACVAAARRDEPGAAPGGSKVVLALTVGADGKPVASKAEGERLSPALARCLERESAGLAFPPFRGEPVRVRVALTLP